MLRRRGSRGGASAQAKKNARGGKTAVSRSTYRNQDLTEDTSSISSSQQSSSSWSPAVQGNKRVREVEPPPPTPKPPPVEPVEQRWEESEGKYMHKKFKKMASSMSAPEGQPQVVHSAPTSVSLPTVSSIRPVTTITQPLVPLSMPVVEPSIPKVICPEPMYNQLTLKHSASSLVQTTRIPPGPPPAHGVTVLSSLRHPYHQSPPPPAPVTIQPAIVEMCDAPSILEEDSPTKKRNVCPFCQMVCAKPSVLDKHIRTHTNERPYPCEPCGFAFKTKSNLYKHCKSRTHSLKVEKGIDSSSADIMAELGDTLREEIEPIQPHSTSIPTMLTNCTSLNRIMENPNHSQPAEMHYRPVTLQQLPTTSTYMTPVIYGKPVQEFGHNYSSRQNSNLYATSSHSNSSHNNYMVVTQDSRSSPSSMSSPPTQYGIQAMAPGNYTTMRLPQAQPILVRPHGTSISAIRVEDKNLVLPQRPITIIQDNRPRLPVAPIPQPVQTQASLVQLITTSAPTPISVSSGPTDLSMGPSKKVAPEFLQQRIDKVISENQAIVETLDPLWPRRYMRQSSKDNDNAEKSHNRGGNRKYNLVNTTNNSASITPSSSTVSTLSSSSVTYLSHGNSTVISRTSNRPPESLVTFPKQPIPLLTSMASSPRILTTSLPQHPEKPMQQDQVYVMAANPLDLATVNRKRTIAFSTVVPSPPVIMTSASELGAAQSVKEVWINSCKKQVVTSATMKPSANVTQLETLSSNSDTSLPFHPENPEGSMIKELLLKTRIINLTPVSSTSSHVRRESTSSNGSGTHIILDQTNSNGPMIPSSKQPEVSLILTSSMSPLPVPNTKVIIPASQSSELYQCTLCQKSLHARDLDHHQCIAASRKQVEEYDESLMSPKRAKLTIVGQNPQHSSGLASMTSGKLLYTATGGGIVSLSKVGPMNQLGLLQIAQPTLHSGGGIVTTASGLSSSTSVSSAMKLDLQSIIPTSVFSIPGIPTPNLSGVLTSMKGSPMPLFSLTGKRLDLTCPTAESTPQLPESPKPVKPVPFVLGIPGPYSQPSTVLSQTSITTISKPAMQRPIANLTNPPPTCQIKVEVSDVSSTVTEMPMASEDAKFLRPTSLPLTPGTFKVKKQVILTSGAATLVSPETPRPRKSYALQYQNGTAYTYLGMKCSTRVCYCCIFRPQPMYVVHKAKLSMYSNWRVVSKDSHSSGLAPAIGLAAYNSVYHQASFGIFTIAKPASKDQTSREANKGRVDDDQMIVTHSSQWKKLSDDGDKKDPLNAVNQNELVAGDQRALNTRTVSPDQGTNRPSSTSSSSLLPPAPTTVEGGYKSLDDDYTYIRGRGRGRYVCNSCGIRCKKPSMLKKHIRTHSNFRPYTCRHCNFAFKTKGNLTKHMKSKAHHKKCVELGISPVPTTVEETQQDLTMNGMDQNSSMHAGDSDSEDDDMEEEEEDEDQFEDAENDDDSYPTILTHPGNSYTANHQESNHHQSSSYSDKEDAARSLLSLQNDPETMRSTPPKSSPNLIHQGLMPYRPKPSTYSSERLFNGLSTGKSTSSPNEIPVSNEQALMFDNTKRVQEFRSECQDTSLNLKQFPPKNTSERYYFSSPAHSTTTISTSVATAGEMSSFATSSLTSSTPVIWSIARMSHTSASTPTVFTSVASQRSNLLPIDIGGGAVSIYKAPSASVTSSIASSSSTPSSSLSVVTIPIKERPADILSPVTESATMLSYINKTSLLATNGPKMFETESDPPALSVYLQERAAVRAANKNTQCISTSPKLSEKTEFVTPVITITSNATITSTTSSSAASMKPSVVYPSSSHHLSEDKYAPRNVTMNVKDLPKDVNSSNTLRHPQLPQDIHLAAANAMAKGSAFTSAASNSGQGIAASGSNENKCSDQKESTGNNSDGEKQTEIFQTNEDGKSVCGICNKVFSKSSQLRLHVNIHYFERPFRCDSCSVSFRTKGHLQKHKRSVGHFKKVNINATFGTPTASDPRPFKCTECTIAFRIHGHLAKHLRSKMHIMKLECSGKLPIGMFAEMERLGTNLNDIDTSDCENSLESLQQIAVRLYKQDPSKLIGQTEELGMNGPEPLVGSDESDSDDSDQPSEEIKSESVVEEHPPAKPQMVLLNGTHHPPTTVLSAPSSNVMPNSTSSSAENFMRRASFSSSGHDDHSTDSEAESYKKCYRCSHCHENFIDMKSLQIHIFVDHQSSKSNPQPAAQPQTANSLPHHSGPTQHNPPANHNQPQQQHHSDNAPVQHNPHNQPAGHNPINSPSIQNIHNPHNHHSHPPISHNPPVQHNPLHSPVALNLQTQPFQLTSHNAPAGLKPHNTHAQLIAAAPHNPPAHHNQHSPHNSTVVVHSATVSYNPTSSPAQYVPKSSPAPYNPRSSPVGQNPRSSPAAHQSLPASYQHHYSLSNIRHPTVLTNSSRPLDLMVNGHQHHNDSNYHRQTSSSSGGSDRHESTSPSIVTQGQHQNQFRCELCGMTGIPNREEFKQHLLSHAAPRPFICVHCDAGFVTSHQLESHLQLHESAA